MRFVLLAAPLAALLCATPALADAPAFPISTPVPVSLGAGAATDYDLSVGSGGSLSVQLQSGDLVVQLVDDHQNTTRDSMSGAATAAIGLQPTSTSPVFHVDLSTLNGAQGVIQFTPGGTSG